MMSVTGAGFTVCDVSPGTSRPWHVGVCGDVDRARAAIEASFPKQAEVTDFYFGDMGERPAEQIVTRYWVRRTTGPDFRVLSTSITTAGRVRVGVTGDVEAARRRFDALFPGRTEVFADQPMVLFGKHPS